MSGRFRVGIPARSDACAIIDALTPGPDDIFLIKTGSSSFHTSPLDIYLRNMAVTDVVYTGVITNGCVLATAIAGFDLGYRGYVVSDATATLSGRLQANAEELLSLYTKAIVDTDLAVRLLGGQAPQVEVDPNTTWRNFTLEASQTV